MRDEDFIAWECEAYLARKRSRRERAMGRRAQARRRRLRVIFFLLAVLAALAAAMVAKALAAGPEAEERELVCVTAKAELLQQVAVKEETPDIPAVTPTAPSVEPVASQVTEPEGPALAYLGEFRITHYCACRKCCGKDESDPWYGITATGTRATEGRTIAVDPSVIPYGSRVSVFYDDGRIVEYIAEDCGGAIKGNRIDVFIADHGRARVQGVKSGSVYIVNEG